MTFPADRNGRACPVPPQPRPCDWVRPARQGERASFSPPSGSAAREVSERAFPFSNLIFSMCSDDISGRRRRPGPSCPRRSLACWIASSRRASRRKHFYRRLRGSGGQEVPDRHIHSRIQVFQCVAMTFPGRTQPPVCHVLTAERLRVDRSRPPEPARSADLTPDRLPIRALDGRRMTLRLARRRRARPDARQARAGRTEARGEGQTAAWSSPRSRSAAGARATGPPPSRSPSPPAGARRCAGGAERPGGRERGVGSGFGQIGHREPFFQRTDIEHSMTHVNNFVRDPRLQGARMRRRTGQRLSVVVYAMRGDYIRLISARGAEPFE